MTIIRTTNNFMFKKHILPILKFIYIFTGLFLVIAGVSYAITSWPKQSGDPFTAVVANELRTWGVNGTTFINNNDAIGNDIYHSGGVGIGTNTLSAGLLLDVEGNIGAAAYCDENGNNCLNFSSSGFLARASGPQTAVGGHAMGASPTLVYINYNIEEYDFGNEFDLTSGTFTAGSAGKYLITAHQSLCGLQNGGAQSMAALRLELNGAVLVEDNAHAEQNLEEGSPCAYMKFSIVLDLAAGDALRLHLIHWDTIDHLAEIRSGSAEDNWFNVFRLR